MAYSDRVAAAGSSGTRIKRSPGVGPDNAAWVTSSEQSVLTRVSGALMFAMALFLVGSIFLHAPWLYQEKRFHPQLGRFGQRFLMRGGYIERLPGPLAGWTAMRDVYPVAGQTFREWWRSRS